MHLSCTQRGPLTTGSLRIGDVSAAARAQSEVWALRLGEARRGEGANRNAHERASDGKRGGADEVWALRCGKGGCGQRRGRQNSMTAVALALLVRRTAQDNTWGPRSEAQMVHW